MPIDRITITNATPPTNIDLNAELQWLGAALGLFNQRDKDSSCYRVFITLIKQQGTPISSDDIANKTTLTRGTVIHHINKLRDAGLITKQQTGYQLQGNNIQEALNNIKQELEEMLNIMQAVAQDIDKKIQQ